MMYELFENFQLNFGHLIKPMIAGTLVSITCSVIGCFIILRKMAFLADAIAHSMLAGVIAGYLLTKMVLGGDAPLAAMLVGALLAGIATVALVGFVTRFSRVKQDTAIGIMYTGIFALGAFVISLKYFREQIHIDIYHYVVGDVLTVPDEQLWLLAIVTSIVLGVVILFFRPLQLTSFDPIMAASIGIPVLAVEYLLTICTSLVVVSGVQIAGVILVVALIITPAATAYLLTDRLSRMIWNAILISVLGFWCGFALAIYSGGSPGSSVVVTMTIFFMLALVFAPRYGLVADWIRRSSSVPQEIMEDVLGSMLRSPGARVAISKIEKNVSSPNMKIRRAITMLARQDLVLIDNDHVMLTEDGQIEANRLVRAHRLWETYLQQTGDSSIDIHEKAHQLEHISDQATVDYLDDKLGHPLSDPHGSIIPAERRAAQVNCSVLREGERARIVKVQQAAKGLGLKAGIDITMGPRLQNGKIWSVELPDGSNFQLDHGQADAVWVTVIETVHE